MGKRVIVDFYTVELPNGAPSFNQIIETVSGTPGDQSRNITRNGTPVRLQDAHRVAQGWEGEMVRIRMDELPVKASLGGEISTLDLEDDEGIGEETAFFYYQPAAVLVLQRNRYGVSPVALGEYFAIKAGIDYVGLVPIVRCDVIQQLASINMVKKFEVAISKIQGGHIFRGQGHSIKTLIRLQEEYQAPHITVSLSMGRMGGSLENVKATARKLMQLGDESVNVRKIEVIGTDDEGGHKVLDLLDARITEELDINLNQGRSLSSKDRLSIVHQAWGIRKQEILQIVTTNGG